MGAHWGRKGVARADHSMKADACHSGPFACALGRRKIRERCRISAETGWIATIAKPRFVASIKLEAWGNGYGAGHDGSTFCDLRHRDRVLRHRLGSARHQCGAAADGKRGEDPGPHPPALWRYRGGAATGPGAARDRR